MKKIVVAMLLILPLIIVASVLVATSVISNEAYIAVERVELNVKNTVEVGLSRGELQLVATVYPTAAKNKAVKWSLENIVCFGDEIQNPASINASGLITFRTYCAFDVAVTTVEGSKTARCSVVVKCDTLNGISLDLNGSGELKTGERRELKVVLNPLDAEVEIIEWKSSNAAIASVDGNGIVTAKSEGAAEISASVGGFTAKQTVTVIKGATAFGNAFATSGSFSVADILPDGEASVVSGGSIADGRFDFADGAKSAILKIGEETVTVNKCDYGAVEIENADLLESKLFYIGKPSPQIRAVYSDVFRREEEVKAVYTVEDAQAAQIGEDGRIKFLAKGDVGFVAVCGALRARITLSAVRPIQYVRLTSVDNDDIRGIAAETVYGNKAYNDRGELTDYVIPLNIQYPEQADWGDFDITVSDERLATLSDHIVVVTGTPLEVANLTVSVTAHHSLYESVPARANRHFKIVEGVNCNNFADLSRAARDGKTVVMQSDVTEAKGDGTVDLVSDFYGNGYMLDATDAEKASPTQPILQVKASGVKISNAHIRADNIININVSNGLSGVAVWTGDEEGEYIDDVSIEYSVLENCYYAIMSTRAALTANGCVMRNASNFGIFIPSRLNSSGDYVYSDVRLNNCIMSNIVATAIGLATEANESEDVPLAKQSSLTSTGFLDIYNWQDVTEPKMLKRELTGNKQLDDMLQKSLGDMLSAELGKPEYAHLKCTVSGKDYVHLGVVTAGAMYESTSEIKIEDPRFAEYSLKTLFETHTLFKFVATFGFKLKPCVLYLYENAADIAPDSEFSEDAETYSRLRGEK